MTPVVNILIVGVALALMHVVQTNLSSYNSILSNKDWYGKMATKFYA